VLSVNIARSAEIHGWVQQVETICLNNGWAQKGDDILLLPPEELLSSQSRWSIIMHTIAP
jgi:hypothetical protein